MFIAVFTVFTVARKWKQSRCPLTDEWRALFKGKVYLAEVTNNSLPNKSRIPCLTDTPLFQNSRLNIILFAMEFTRALWKDNLPVHGAGNVMPLAQHPTEP